MTKRVVRRLPLIALGLGALLLLSGCVGGQQTITSEQTTALRDALVAFQPLGQAAADTQQKAWQKQLDDLMRTKGPADQVARLQFLLAYAQEKQQLYQGALDQYAKVGGGYRPLAQFRRGEIYRLANRDLKAAGGAYSAAATVRLDSNGVFPAVGPPQQPELVLASDPSARIVTLPLLRVAQQRMDLAYRDGTMYKAVDALVSALGADPRYSYALALIVLAVVVKVLTTPFTTKAFKNIRAMQRLEPLRKELQEKYQGDQATLAREQMRLFKKYKVNPLGGCLPMLIQMPILILVYQAIRVYIFRFASASFLWVDDLSMPDIPLLILYAGSMFISQKLTAMPAADPQQQQMQNTMAYMMPIMFTVLFATLPSAFILYWFMYNVLITAHQWWLMRQPLPSLEEEESASAAETGPAPVRPQRIRRRR